MNQKLKTINLKNECEPKLSENNSQDYFIEGPINLNEKLYIGIDFECGKRRFTGFMNNIPIGEFEDPCDVYFTNTISDFGVVFDPTLSFGSLPIKLLKDPNDPFFLISPCINIGKSNPTIFFPKFSESKPSFGSIISDSLQDSPQLYIQFRIPGLLEVVDELLSGKAYKIGFYTKSDDGNFIPVNKDNTFTGLSILLPVINDNCKTSIVPENFKTNKEGKIPKQTPSRENVLYVKSEDVIVRVYQVFNYSKDTNNFCKRNTKITEIIFKKNFYNKLLDDKDPLTIRRVVENKDSNFIDKNILDSFNGDDVEKIQMILESVNQFNVENTQRFLVQTDNKISELNNFFTRNIVNMKTVNFQITKMMENIKMFRKDIDLVDIYLGTLNITDNLFRKKIESGEITFTKRLKRQILKDIGFDNDDVETGKLDDVNINGVLKNYVDGIEKIEIVNSELQNFLNICVKNLSTLEMLTRKNRIFTVDNCDILLKVSEIKEKLVIYNDFVMKNQINVNCGTSSLREKIDVCIILTFSTLELCLKCH